MTTATATASAAAAPARAPVAVTAEQRYLFDLQGFLVVPNAIDASLLAELNAEFDRRAAAEVPAAATQHRFYAPPNALLAWGDAYRALIDLPTIAPFLDEFIGGAWRLDHDYADLIRAGRGPIGNSLHGGSTPYDECCSYQLRDGRIRSGLTAVAFNLRDVGPRDGGFGCVPGSHKANFALPEAWRDLTSDLRPCTIAVPAPAGAAIIFTEALTHGTLPWHGAHDRRTLFYKYSPSSVAWSANVYDVDALPGLTPRQREILEPPNARYHGRKVPRLA